MQIRRMMMSSTQPDLISNIYSVLNWSLVHILRCLSRQLEANKHIYKQNQAQLFESNLQPMLLTTTNL